MPTVPDLDCKLLHADWMDVSNRKPTPPLSLHSLRLLSSLASEFFSHSAMENNYPVSLHRGKTQKMRPWCHHLNSMHRGHKARMSALRSLRDQVAASDGYSIDSRVLVSWESFWEPRETGLGLSRTALLLSKLSHLPTLQEGSYSRRKTNVPYLTQSSHPLSPGPSQRY